MSDERCKTCDREQWRPGENDSHASLCYRTSAGKSGASNCEANRVDWRARALAAENIRDSFEAENAQLRRYSAAIYRTIGARLRQRTQLRRWAAAWKRLAKRKRSIIRDMDAEVVGAMDDLARMKAERDVLAACCANKDAPALGRELGQLRVERDRLRAEADELARALKIALASMLAAERERGRLREFVKTVARFAAEPHRLEVTVQELIDEAKRVLRGEGP